jgi:hypothetical protein
MNLLAIGSCQLDIRDVNISVFNQKHFHLTINHGSFD